MTAPADHAPDQRGSSTAPDQPTSSTTAERTSASRTIDLDAPRPDQAAAGTSSDRARDLVLAGATVLGPALMIAGLLIETDEGGDDATGTQMLAAIADSGADRFWTSNFLAAIGLCLLGAGGLAVMRLVRARGGALATVGGVLAMVSGAMAGAGLFMYGAVAAVMADPDLDREQMGALQDRLSDAWQVMPPFVGFIGGALALLLLAGALWRSRVVPVWVPVAVVLSAVAFFLVGDGGLLEAATLLPLLAAYAVVAAALVRRRT